MTHLTHQASPRVLVIGDVMLDKYLIGFSHRLSPEAPVPVVEPSRETQRAGGAANLALNLSALNIQVRLIGLTGTGQIRKDLLTSLGKKVDTQGLVASSTRPTTTKTRILVEDQQLLRIDRESTAKASTDECEQLTAAWRAARETGIEGIVLSDYGKGALPLSLCREVIDWATNNHVPVFVDPSRRDFGAYRGATVIKPNCLEFESITGCTVYEGDITSETREWLRRYELHGMLITLGAKGLKWITADEAIDVPAQPCQVFDVTGAGDTALAAFVNGSIRHWPIETNLEYVNQAAANVISKVGTQVVNLDEVANVPQKPKRDWQERSSWGPLIKRWQMAGEKIVFTNGCFDLLHPGHIHLLRQARACGDRLIVGVNSDRSVRNLKGALRPIQSLEDRCNLISNLRDVDLVIPFGEDTPLELIQLLRPDVLVKGADYSREAVVGGDFVEHSGGEVILVSLLPEQSTTSIVRRLREAQDRETEEASAQTSNALEA